MVALLAAPWIIIYIHTLSTEYLILYLAHHVIIHPTTYYFFQCSAEVRISSNGTAAPILRRARLSFNEKYVSMIRTVVLIFVLSIQSPRKLELPHH